MDLLLLIKYFIFSTYSAGTLLGNSVIRFNKEKVKNLETF